MASKRKTFTDEQFLKAIAGDPKTAGEVARAVRCTTQTARVRLEKLVKAGKAEGMLGTRESFSGFVSGLREIPVRVYRILSTTTG